MKWFRVYTDIMDNEKISKISTKSFKIFIYFLAFSAENEKNGKLGSDIKILSWRLRITEKCLTNALEELQKFGLIVTKDGQYIIKNWEERQFRSDDISARVKRYRDEKKRSSETLHETLNVSSQNRTDTEQNRIEKREEKRENGASAAPHPQKSKAEKVKAEIEAMQKRLQAAWMSNAEFYQTKYPGHDYDLAVRSMTDWIRRNYGKAKKYEDWSLFIESWLRRETPVHTGARKAFTPQTSNLVGHNPTPTDTRPRIEQLKEALRMYDEHLDDLDEPGRRARARVREELQKLVAEKAS